MKNDVMNVEKDNSPLKKIEKFFMRIIALIALIPGWLFTQIVYRPKIYIAQDFAQSKKGSRRIKGKAIIMCNHQWWYDAPLMCTLYFTRRVSTFTAKQVVSGLRKPFMLALSCIPVDREVPDLSSLQECVRRLNVGGVVCSFPEGQINTKNELLPFKTGTAYMAMHSNSPVYPVYILGNYQPFQRLQMIIGKPIYLSEEFNGDTGTFARNKATKLLYKELCSLKDELESKVDEKYIIRAHKFRERFGNKLNAGNNDKISTNKPDLSVFNEKWEYTAPSYGSQIRVKRSSYYHHGIYIDDGHVIHFGDGNDNEDIVNSENNVVHQTDISQFLKGGFLETRVYSKGEKRILNDSKKIVALAKSHLGEGGYDFLHNNCEHFSNLCAFNVRYSAQTYNIENADVNTARK